MLLEKKEQEVLDTHLLMTASVGKIYYEDNKKFQTTRPALVRTEVKGYDIMTSYCRLFPDGKLIIFSKWAWDGASGGIDTKRTIRGSSAHDILYKLIRQGLLPQSERNNADLTLRNIMLEDKAIFSRAWAWLKAVSWFGAKNVKPENQNKELIAP